MKLAYNSSSLKILSRRSFEIHFPHASSIFPQTTRNTFNIAFNLMRSHKYFLAFKHPISIISFFLCLPLFSTTQSLFVFDFKVLKEKRESLASDEPWISMYFMSHFINSYQSNLFLPLLKWLLKIELYAIAFWTLWPKIYLVSIVKLYYY